MKNFITSYLILFLRCFSDSTSYFSYVRWRLRYFPNRLALSDELCPFPVINNMFMPIHSYVVETNQLVMVHRNLSILNHDSWAFDHIAWVIDHITHYVSNDFDSWPCWWRNIHEIVLKVMKSMKIYLYIATVRGKARLYSRLVYEYSDESSGNSFSFAFCLRYNGKNQLKRYNYKMCGYSYSNLERR